MDLQMPEMDGFKATRLLRNRPHLRELPIIAMTAHPMVEERKRCLEAGMNDQVSKPIEPDALFATLKRWAKPRGARATPTEGKTAKLADESILPEIDGVDATGGLKRVNGNKRLYRELLAQFAAQQDELRSQLLTAVESGDRKLAERIGLGQVFAAAEKSSHGEGRCRESWMERAIRDADAVAPALAEEFVDVVNRQAQSIQQAIREAMPSPRAVTDGRLGVDVPAVSGGIQRLGALLESSDGEAADSFEALEGALEEMCDKRRLSALGAAISEFDFEGARKKLDEITKEYGTKWEQSK
jgi:two-component system, sensor histidine kinase and response regulator